MTLGPKIILSTQLMKAKSPLGWKSILREISGQEDISFHNTLAYALQLAE